MRIERDGKKGILDRADYRCSRDLATVRDVVLNLIRCGIDEGFQVASC
jgi:hypothetical protein